MNENVKMSYVDAQSYVTNYYRVIQDKSEFEQIASDKILEYNNTSLKRKGSLLSYWGYRKRVGIIFAYSRINRFKCLVKSPLMSYFKQIRANFSHVFNRFKKKKNK